MRKLTPRTAWMNPAGRGEPDVQVLDPQQLVHRSHSGSPARHAERLQIGDRRLVERRCRAPRRPRRRGARPGRTRRSGCRCSPWRRRRRVGAASSRRAGRGGSSSRRASCGRARPSGSCGARRPGVRSSVLGHFEAGAVAQHRAQAEHPEDRGEPAEDRPPPRRRSARWRTVRRSAPARRRRADSRRPSPRPGRCAGWCRRRLRPPPSGSSQQLGHRRPARPPDGRR